jgi:hypothetical protein
MRQPVDATPGVSGRQVLAPVSRIGTRAKAENLCSALQYEMQRAVREVWTSQLGRLRKSGG